MPKIQVLTQEVINKIAAGEVIERPASVVKELVENALDAGASRVVVEIKDSGKKLIRVTDDGKGMEQEDCQKSILRHATSKITNSEDLFAIQTLGFRGEALSSIAAISQLSIVTKTAEMPEGFNLVVENGAVISSGVIAAMRGTTTEVVNLFFNTPARKKFLKTDAVELRHIIDVVTSYALANSLVNFKLLHERHNLLNSPSTDDQRQNIASIYGAKLAKELIEINHKDKLVEIKGFLGTPHQTRNDKSLQAFFINGRWVRNNELRETVYLAFKSMLFVGKHPVFFLNLTLDEKKIDVNVHPNKLEIKIEQIREICNALREALNSVLENKRPVPLIDLEIERQVTFKPQTKYSFEKSTQKALEVEEKVNEDGTENEKKIQERELQEPEEEKIKESEPHSTLPQFKLLGQIHKTFFVAETIGGMLLIDQHAAHERVMYEKYMRQFANKNVQTQSLLQGGMIEFTAAQKVMVEENLEALKGYGFLLEHFGGNTFILKTIPQVFYRLQPKEAIFELIDTISESSNSLQKVHEDIVSRMACRSAVMAGEELSVMQMQNILTELGKCSHPYTCAHGRPTMIKTLAQELEKKFKRC